MIFDFIKNLFGKGKQKLNLPDPPELEDFPDAEAPQLEEAETSEPPELEEAESPEAPKLDEFGESTEPPEFSEEALSSALDGLTEADLKVPVPETADWIERDTNVAVSPNMAAFDGPGGGSFTAPDKEDDTQIVSESFALFAVKVWQDGGSTDGTSGAQCDRTYEVRTLEATSITTGTQLGTDLTPKKKRPTTGPLNTPPTDGVGYVGLGYYDENGAFALYDANESLNTDLCA